MLHRFPFSIISHGLFAGEGFGLWLVSPTPSPGTCRLWLDVTELRVRLRVPEFSLVCPSSVIVVRAASSSDPNNLYRNQSMTTCPGLRLSMTAAGELPVGERWRAIGACLRLSGQIRHVDETSEVRNGRVQARTLPRG
jgi:hypothetical protein